jgi:uncharacterized protein involved in exopolysaccharide biosynthesis
MLDNKKTEEADNNFSVYPSDDVINLRQFIGILYARKILITVVTIIFAATSVLYAITLPNVYKSEALLAPADSSSTNGLSSLANQFGGLASIAGIDIGGQGNSSKVHIAMEVIKSRKFISGFISAHSILPELMAVKAWDSVSGEVIYDETLYIQSEGKWVRDVVAPFNPEPSMQEAFTAFSNIMNVSKDVETGMVKLSIEHISPSLAKKWVDWLVADINRNMKTRDVIEAKKSTQFLTKQLQVTNIADIKSVLYKLIEEQAKVIMFAEVRDEYVFKTIDPAIVPELKFKPKRALICILGTFLGGVLSVLFVLFRYYIKESDACDEI